MSDMEKLHKAGLVLWDERCFVPRQVSDTIEFLNALQKMAILSMTFQRCTFCDREAILRVLYTKKGSKKPKKGYVCEMCLSIFSEVRSLSSLKEMETKTK